MFFSAGGRIARRVKGNQVQILSDPVTVSEENCRKSPLRLREGAAV